MEQTYQSSLPNGSQGDQNKDSFFLITILIVSLGTLSFLLFGANESDYAQNSVPRVIKTAEASVLKATATPNATREAAAKGKLVNTSIQPEAKQEFTFRLMSYAENTLYQLDTGDGKTLTFKNGEARHTYSRSGEFYGKLYATYGGETVVVQIKKIPVAPALEMNFVPGTDY